MTLVGVFWVPPLKYATGAIFGVRAAFSFVFIVLHPLLFLASLYSSAILFAFVIQATPATETHNTGLD